LISGKWETRGEQSRELKYYRLTPTGRRRLHAETSKWTQLVEAITRVMRPAEG
jgi:DNA-binding PadR family transcriptional regulator